MTRSQSNDSRYRIAIATDDAGVALRDHLLDTLRNDPHVAEINDLGVRDRDDKTPYPVPSVRAAEAVRDGTADRALVLGGTGLGEAISANKVRGIRAAVATDPYSLERSILSNNCQVLALGERVIGFLLADRLVHDWLSYRFDPASPSAAKLAVLSTYENTGDIDYSNPDATSPKHPHDGQAVSGGSSSGP